MRERRRSLARRILRSEWTRGAGGVRSGPGCSSWTSPGLDNSLRNLLWSKFGAEGLSAGTDDAVGETWSGSGAWDRFNLTSSSSSSSSSSLEGSSPCLPLPQGNCFPLLCQGRLLQAAAAQGGGKRRDGRPLGPASEVLPEATLLGPAPGVDLLGSSMSGLSSAGSPTMSTFSAWSLTPISTFSIGTTSMASSSSSPSSMMSRGRLCCNTWTEMSSCRISTSSPLPVTNS